MNKVKAIVFKHENGGTYVLDREGSFSFLSGYTSQLIGAEVEIASQPSNNLKKLSSIAACLILLLSLGLFIRLWTQTSHFVYVDINPSIELQFNRFDRLRTVTPLNDDGEVLVGNMNLRSASDKIIIDIINEAIEQGFLVAVNGKPGVLITVVPAGSRLPDTRISTINLTLEKNGMDDFTVVEAGSMDLKDRAEELNVSPGKLMLAEAAVKASGGLTPLEDLLQKRIEELFDAIEDAKAEHSGSSAGYYTAPTEYSDDNPDTSQSPERTVSERRGINPAGDDISLSTDTDPLVSPKFSPGFSPRVSRGNTRPGNPAAIGSPANDPPPGEPAVNEPQPNSNSNPGNSSGANPCNADNPCGKPDCNRCNNNGNSGDNNGVQPNPNSGSGNNSGANPCNANNPCGKPDCNRCNNNGNSNGAQPNPNIGPGNNSGNNPCNANNPCGQPDCNRCNNGNNGNSNGAQPNPNIGPGNNSGNNPCNANNPCGQPDCNRCNKSNGNNGNSG